MRSISSRRPQATPRASLRRSPVERGAHRLLEGVDRPTERLQLIGAEQDAEPALKQRFATLAKTLEENEATIVAELNAVQGSPVDIGGYYRPDIDLLRAAMRPSATFNRALQQLRTTR